MGAGVPMTWFQFRAVRHDGGAFSGSLSAETPDQAKAVLIARELHPLMIELQHSRLPPAQGRVSRRELAMLFRTLASLTVVGVPLDRAVAASRAMVSERLAPSLKDIQDGLAAGLGLSAALEKSRSSFPSLVLGMLRAGEHGGQLAAALEETAAHLEGEAELQSRLYQALAYPCILAVAGLVSVVVIIGVILPRFADLLRDAGNTLPPTTKLLLSAGEFARHSWLLLVLSTVILVGLVAHGLSKPRVRLRVLEWLLAVPLVGAVMHALATARVTRALGSTLGSGMALLPALMAASEAAGNDAIRARLERVEQRISRGEPLASAFALEDALTPSAMQLVAVGEASGRLAFMTSRAGSLAALEAERSLKLLVGLLEPALVVAFGALVALVAAALLQAVYGLRPGG